MRPRPAPIIGRATNVIQIFCPGGVSHVDMLDYKPELQRRSGKPFDESGKIQFFASKPGDCQGSYWKFRQRGQSGLWVSNLFPKLAECVDDMAFVYSTVSKSAIHGPATFMMNSGFILPGFPAMGSWVTYGLGSETKDLPSFVVLPDSRGVPSGGPANWGAGFLPARRLVERGVRFVQLWCGADNVTPPRPNWDAHENILVNHGKHGPVLDAGAAALIADLKAHGLLDTTLVICCSEFGRHPAAQGKGRDHNPRAFTTRLAGGGIKGGVGYGESDELGFKVVVNPDFCYDIHVYGASPFTTTASIAA